MRISPLTPRMSPTVSQKGLKGTNEVRQHGFYTVTAIFGTLYMIGYEPSIMGRICLEQCTYFGVKMSFFLPERTAKFQNKNSQLVLT